MSLTFRSLENKDLKYLAELFNYGFQKYYTEMNLTEEQVNQMLVRENIDLTLSFEAVLDGKVIGFVWTGVREDKAWCGGIGIGLEYRGHGYGRELMVFCMGQCRDRGLITYQLECIKKNERGIRLYKSLGLEIIGELYNFKNDSPEPLSLADHQYELVKGSEMDVINLWDELHQIKKSWQMDLPSLLYRLDLGKIILLKDGEINLGILVYMEYSHGIGIYDLAVKDENKELCQILLAELHRLEKPISATLISDQSVLTQVLERAGYVRYLDQVRMLIQL